MPFFDKHYHDPGTSPGSLREHPGRSGQSPQLRLVRYDDATVDSVDLSATDLPTLQKETGRRTWLHVQGCATGATLAAIGEHFKLHLLALEDVHNTGQRPKLETYDNQIFVILALPRFADGRVSMHQVSLFAASDFVVSFCDGPLDPFEPVLRRLTESRGQMRGRGTDYLLYALIDAVVDQGFPLLEGFGRELESLEEDIVRRPTHATLSHIHRIKRELILLRRMLWPQRDVISNLIRDEIDQIDDDTRVYLHDCQDHAVQIMDLLETYREIGTSMLDIYLSSVSNRMNETMRVLTVIATIFIPLTFIAGVYGMNFSGNHNSPWAMPEVSWYYGYPLILLVMLSVAVGMLVFFRRKRWF